MGDSMSKNSVAIHNFSGGLRQCLSDMMYGIFKAALRAALPIFFRMRMVGRDHCPDEGGPLVVISNHLGEWDPPIMGSHLPWQVHWLAKVELFELLGGWTAGFLRMLHCVPVDREKADTAAIKQCVRLARGRRPVLVFAEGGIRLDESSILGSKPQLKEGAAIIAIAAGCPILPVVLNGTRAAFQGRNWFLLRRPMIEIMIGPVFRVEGRDRERATAQMLARLLELKVQLKQQAIC